MLETLVSGAGSGLLGGIVGAVGGIFTKFLEIKKLRVMNELEVKRMAHSERIQELGIEASVKEAEAALRIKHVEQDMAEYAGDIDALMASYQHDAALGQITAEMPTPIRYLQGVVNAIRSSIRPALTIMAAYYFVQLYTGLTVKLGEINSEQATAVIVATYGDAANAAIFLTMTTVTWWFSSRTKSYSAKRREL